MSTNCRTSLKIADSGLEPFRRWNRRWQVWKGVILLRQLASRRAGSQHPQHSSEYRARVAPRTPAAIRTARGSQHQLQNCPLLVVQFPASGHRCVLRFLELLQKDPASRLAYL